MHKERNSALLYRRQQHNTCRSSHAVLEISFSTTERPREGRQHIKPPLSLGCPKLQSILFYMNEFITTIMTEEWLYKASAHGTSTKQRNMALP